MSVLFKVFWWLPLMNFQKMLLGFQSWYYEISAWVFSAILVTSRLQLS